MRHVRIADSRTSDISSNALSSASKSAHTPTFLESLLADDHICDNDAVVLIEQYGVRALTNMIYML